MGGKTVATEGVGRSEGSLCLGGKGVSVVGETRGDAVDGEGSAAPVILLPDQVSIDCVLGSLASDG